MISLTSITLLHIKKRDNMAKIAIIDDNPEITDIISTTLRDEGHETFSYNSSEVGFQEILIIKPDILFLDLFMPGLTGYDLISSIKHLRFEIPIVAISGGFNKVDKETSVEMAQKLGAQFGITKPFEIQQIVDVVKKILN